MISGSGGLPNGDADLNQEEILDLIERVEAVLDRVTKSPEGGVEPPDTVPALSSSAPTNTGRRTATFPEASAMVYQSQKPSSEPSGADPAMIGSGPRMIAAKDAVSKVWAAAAPALPAFASTCNLCCHLRIRGRQLGMNALLFSVMQDPDRGFALNSTRGCASQHFARLQTVPPARWRVQAC